MTTQDAARQSAAISNQLHGIVELGVSTHAVAPSALYRPLVPESRDQGDPFVVERPAGAPGRYCYYAFATCNGDVIDGRAFTVYGSDDLVDWRSIGVGLEADPLKPYWAPWVGYLPHLERPWVMLYSRGRGTGIEGHIGHTLYRAESDRPEGPYRDTGALVLPRSVDFAIDPDVHIMRDGTYRFACAIDYVEGERIGTGLAESVISPDLTRLESDLRPMIRPSADWQIFNASRTMPWKSIPGVDWQAGDTVCWHCIEGPASISDDIVLYSGGSFEFRYGIGVLRRDPRSGKWADLSREPGSRLLADGMLERVYTPGHCSVIRGPEGAWYMMFHARFGDPASPRQMALAPLVVHEA
jgi:hypothetical protein